MILSGTDIMVFGPEKMTLSKVNQLLILSWNKKDEIMAEFQEEHFFTLMPYDNKLYGGLYENSI
jgi:hypothetical protein